VGNLKRMYSFVQLCHCLMLLVIEALTVAVAALVDLQCLVAVL
jgi:hypothetical protein